MICSSCRQSLLSRFSHVARIRASQIRQTSSALTSPTSLPSQPTPDISLPSRSNPPSATSSQTPGLSQPLTTPLLPSTASALRPSKPKPSSKSQKLAGSIPGGAPLYGIGYTKAKPIVLAKEDDEYPDWLWTLLDTATEAGAPGKGKDGKKSAADIAALPKAAREKYARKQEKLLEGVAKKVPLHEQSRDLTEPGDSAEVSMQRRGELVKSSRGARRQAIKEENFLRGL